jgi:rhodanese-related sulfurtransferase
LIYTDICTMHQISPATLKEWIDTGKDFILIDVREDWEREEYNSGGAHIPFEDVLSRQAALPKDKDVVLYCEKGIRSSIVIQRLEALGFNNLYNLSGGMKAWKAAV